MPRLLFALPEAGGNVPPQLALARKLASRGHQVRVLGDPSMRADVAAAQCSFVPFTGAPHRADRENASDFLRVFEPRTPMGKFARTRDRLMFGPALEFARDVMAELKREPADLVLSDILIPGAAAGAERCGTPHVFTWHTLFTIPRPGLPGPGPGFLPADGVVAALRDRIFGALYVRTFESGIPALNKARAALDLPAIRDIRDLFGRASAVLVLTSPSFDLASETVPANVHYVGPQLEDPAWAGDWRSPWTVDDPRPLVVVGFSTMNQAQGALLQRVADALGGLNVRGLITTGPAVEPSSIVAPPNVAVFRAAPHGEVFAHASAVVTHCGLGTVTRALAYGLPIVGVPMGNDQADIAARVVHHAAGVRLRSGASVAAIRRAVREVLENDRYGAAARRLAPTLRADSEASVDRVQAIIDACT